jgi:hypothetical protein
MSAPRVSTRGRTTNSPQRIIDTCLKSHSRVSVYNSTLRRVAKVLHARVRVTFEPEKKGAGMRVAEAAVPYRAKRTLGKRT